MACRDMWPTVRHKSFPAETIPLTPILFETRKPQLLLVSRSFGSISRSNEMPHRRPLQHKASIGTTPRYQTESMDVEWSFVRLRRRNIAEEGPLVPAARTSTFVGNRCSFSFDCIVARFRSSLLILTDGAYAGCTNVFVTESDKNKSSCPIRRL